MKLKRISLRVWVYTLFAASLFSTIPVLAQKQEAAARLKSAETDIDKLKSDLLELTAGESSALAREKIDRLRATVEEMQQSISQMTAEKASVETDAARQREETERLAAQIAELQKSTDSLRSERAALEASPPAGYDRGFFVQSKNGRLRLTINGYVRPQYTLVLMRQYKTQANGDLAPSPDGKADPDRTIIANDFDIESARMEISVSLFEKVRGVFSLDFGALSGEVQYPINADIEEGIEEGAVHIDDRAVTFIDAFGEYKAFDELVVRAGQFKVPFDRETAFGDREQVFSARSLMTRRYFVYADDPSIDETDVAYRSAYEVLRGSSFGRDIGAELSGAVQEGIFDYRVGVFNGAGLNRENDNRDVLVAGRVSVSPLGAFASGMSDLEITKAPRFSIGAGIAWDLLSHQSAFSPEKTYNSSDISMTLDAEAEWRGLSAFASVFHRRSDHGTAIPDEDPLRSLGAAVQAAYYISAVKLQPALRYSFYNARLDRKGDHVHEASVGVNYYMFPDHLRIGLEYRGLFPSDIDASYLAPLGVLHDNQHEITVSAEVGF